MVETFPLFRQKTIEARRRKLYGDVSLWQPVSGVYFSASAIIIVAIALLFLSIGKYSHKETVLGWIVPNKGLSQIYAIRGGVIAENLVKQGDYVKEGQIIARLKIDLSNTNGEIIPMQRAQTNARIAELDIQAKASNAKYSQEFARINGQIASTNSRLNAELSRLLTQEIGIKQKLREDNNRLNQTIRANALELEKLEAAKTIYSQNYEIEKTSLNRYKTALKSGAVSEIDVDKQSQTLLASKNQINEIERQIQNTQSTSSDIKSQIASLNADINTQLNDIKKQREGLIISAASEVKELIAQSKMIDPSAKTELSQIRSAKSQLETGLTELSLQDGYVIRAPISGMVASLNLRVGEAASTNAPIASIAPENAKIEAELLVPTRSAGFMLKGMDVRVMVDAYPYQKFGIIKGQIIDITRSAFRPGELNSPIEFKEPVYRVRASLPSDKIKTYNHFTNLQSGMTLRADIITDRRTFLEWILDPLFAARAKME